MSKENPTALFSEAETLKFFEELSKEGVRFEVRFSKKRPIQEFEEDFTTLSVRFTDSMENINRVSKELFSRCVTYLQRPMLLDTFTNHGARRAWQTEKTINPKIARIFTPFQQANKLRYNNISGLVEMVTALKLYVGSNAAKVEWDKKEKILTLLGEFPDLRDYEEIDLETKLDRVNKIDDFCERFITLFSKQAG